MLKISLLDNQIKTSITDVLQEEIQKFMGVAQQNLLDTYFTTIVLLTSYENTYRN